MAQPFIGEIRMFAGNFAPVGWALCNGQILAIAENDTLFQLIGTTYGGDGQSTFALPDLRGRAPIHWGSNTFLGEAGGVETVTLSANQVSGHSHEVHAVSGVADASSPTNNALSVYSGSAMYSSSVPDAAMAAEVVGPAGSPTPAGHENLQPYTCVNFIISLFGIFPTPS